MNLNDILKNTSYDDVLFSEAEKAAVESAVVVKETKSGHTPFIQCPIRGKEIRLTPEEVIRQLFLQRLIREYHYPVSRIHVEYPVNFGREVKRADIVVLDKDNPTAPYIIVEVKSPKWKDGKEQLRSYCNASGAPLAVWTNGKTISYYNRKDPNYFEAIPDIPKAAQKLSDIYAERWTYEDLIKKDKLVTKGITLKDVVLEMEDEVMANFGGDHFEEIFKLVFTKLFDEMESGRDAKRHLEFRNYGDSGTQFKAQMQALFDKAKEKWDGVFNKAALFALAPSHLAGCVSYLESIKLFNSNLEIVDEAFEYLVNQNMKGDKGQYFTPRYVIDMCVKMLNPKPDEYMIDTAAGSCGFPMHTVFHVWGEQFKNKGLNKSQLFTVEKKPPECADYVQKKVFAIDFDERVVRVGRMLNLIAGDGQTNVLYLNTLDWDNWDVLYGDPSWNDIYGIGWKNIRTILENPKLQTIQYEETKNGKTYIREKTVYDCKKFKFDLLMANPPFAGDIKQSDILSRYELAKDPKGKAQKKVGRDILFIERNLDFLKPGGRMAVVLPQGRFNNASDKAIREFIAERCRILAVVGLHGNVFKPHTGTKTSVLFVQKWDEKLCPKKEDYNIFFATMREPSKDSSGEKIYMRVNGENLRDAHGHFVVKHDLFNHEGITQDGIAEAFMEFAKKENLSFF